jgi:hypothetical protein
MFGIPRFWASTLICESGVWNSWVMMPLVTEMSLGTASNTTMSRNPKYWVCSFLAVVKTSWPMPVA